MGPGARRGHSPHRHPGQRGHLSNGELWRLITDVRAEISARLDQLVRRDVYDARETARDRAMDALQRDIQEIEAEREKEADRRPTGG
ncbi:hypothetical protein [Streptomyces sp. NPDC052114]|uniref:hypothetical protein n=1 Tax=unclassified Streptomyces TaxID=2593676 RepID=UPI0034157177